MDESTTGPVNPEGPPEEGPEAAEGAEPPAGSPLPTLATGSGTKMSGKTIIIGIVAIAIIAVAVWFFAFRGSGVGDKFVGTWVPVDASVGGWGLVIDRSGSVFTLKTIDKTGGPANALTGKLRGDTLEVTIPAAFAVLGAYTTITATYIKQTDHLMLKVGGDGADEMTEFRRAASIPITSPSVTPDAQLDFEIRTATKMVAAAIDMYASDNNGTYPTTADRATLGTYANPWPTNPVTGAPMADSSSIGDFFYRVTGNNNGYVLAGHLTDGTDYFPHGRPTPTAMSSPVN